MTQRMCIHFKYLSSFCFDRSLDSRCDRPNGHPRQQPRDEAGAGRGGEGGAGDAAHSGVTVGAELKYLHT